MPPPYAQGVTVTRLRAAAASDGYGGTIKDWSNPDRLTIEGCLIAPRTFDEERTNGRQGVAFGFSVIAPYGCDVRFDDRMEIPDGVFEVEGEVNHWANMQGVGRGTFINLRRVDG